MRAEGHDEVIEDSGKLHSKTSLDRSDILSSCRGSIANVTSITVQHGLLLLAIYIRSSQMSSELLYSDMFYF